MILGIGTDIVDIGRIDKILEEGADAFIARCFSMAEQDRISAQPDEKKASHMAKRWAAKEACAKALGSGIAAGVYLKDIEIQSLENGAPVISLSAGAKNRLQSLTPSGKQARIDITLSDDAGLALAFVVISAE